MDREYVVEHGMVERYLAGQLSEDEQAALEQHCLWCQETLDDLELTTKLRQGIADASTQEDRWQPGFVSRMLHSPQYAAAASVLLAFSVVVSGVMLWDRDALRGRSYSGGMEVFTLETMRGAPGDPSANSVYLGEPDRPITLLVYPGLGDYDRYRAAIYPLKGGAVVWEDGIRLRTDALALVVPSNILPPGDYRLRIEGIASDGEPALLNDIPFHTANEVR